MCSIGYHTCECGEEYSCHQQNSECSAINGYGELCSKCEYWAEEIKRDEEKDARRKWEQEEWERQFKDE